MLISFLQYSVSYLHSTKNTLKNTKTYAANLDKKAIRVFCCSNSARGGHLVLWVGSISTRDGHTLFKTWWWSITVNNFTFYLYDFECKSHLNIIIITTTQIFLLIYRRQSSIILVNVCNIFVPCPSRWSYQVCAVLCCSAADCAPQKVSLLLTSN